MKREIRTTDDTVDCKQIQHPLKMCRNPQAHRNWMVIRVSGTTSTRVFVRRLGTTLMVVPVSSHWLHRRIVYVVIFLLPVYICKHIVNVTLPELYTYE